MNLYRVFSHCLTMSNNLEILVFRFNQVMLLCLILIEFVLTKGEKNETSKDNN